MRAWRRAVRGPAFLALSLLALVSCGDTTVNQQAEGDAKVCVEDSTCLDGEPSEEPDPPDPGVPGGGGPDPSSSEPEEEGGGAEGGEPGGEDTVESGEATEQGGGGGSVAGETVPVRVNLSGGNLPDGLRDTTDGCWMGTCTDWNAADVVVGDESFSTGFIIECTIGCGENISGWFQAKLAGKYSRFDATFGISAESPGNDRTETLAVNVIDQGTGKVLYSETLEYGRSYPVRGLDVSKVGLLRISFEGALGGTHGAVGSPVVRR
ncbi:hypothetical protein [Streptomyces sp. NPDC014676]|uniref:hypothetical protein n=1 Tax=Streptomyces sp. NPDC014676 TaxID=3364879 RepID=UPI0037000DF2